jgi:hypothetical protein
MLDDLLPLALRCVFVDSGCGRSEVGVPSWFKGEDQASVVVRLGVMLRLGRTRPRKPFFLSCSRRFARVVPGPARGEDFCSGSSMSRGGYGDVIVFGDGNYCMDMLYRHLDDRRSVS